MKKTEIEEKRKVATTWRSFTILKRNSSLKHQLEWNFARKWFTQCSTLKLSFQRSCQATPTPPAQSKSCRIHLNAGWSNLHEFCFKVYTFTVSQTWDLISASASANFCFFSYAPSESSQLQTLSGAQEYLSNSSSPYVPKTQSLHIIWKPS